MTTWELICVSLLSRVSEQSELHQAVPDHCVVNCQYHHHGDDDGDDGDDGDESLQSGKRTG